MLAVLAAHHRRNVGGWHISDITFDCHDCSPYKVCYSGAFFAFLQVLNKIIAPDIFVSHCLSLHPSSPHNVGNTSIAISCTKILLCVLSCCKPSSTAQRSRNHQANTTPHAPPAQRRRRAIAQYNPTVRLRSLPSRIETVRRPLAHRCAGYIRQTWSTSFPSLLFHASLTSSLLMSGFVTINAHPHRLHFIDCVSPKNAASPPQNGHGFNLSIIIISTQNSVRTSGSTECLRCPVSQSRRLERAQLGRGASLADSVPFQCRCILWFDSSEQSYCLFHRNSRI